MADSSFIEMKKYQEEIIEEFRKKWSRIEKTMTGHISGRKIWDADTKGSDDEANYLYVDETIEQFLLSALEKAEKETIERIKKKDWEGCDWHKGTKYNPSLECSDCLAKLEKGEE